MWTLKSLLECVNSVSVEINGKFVPARPTTEPFNRRFRAAWLVLTGKADAFKWPEGQ
jgi:hypothetical protein